MNRRLLTPAIVLVSFATAFGFTSRHAGLWRRAPVAATAAASLPAPAAVRQPAGVTVPAAAPPSRQESPPPESEPPRSPSLSSPPEPPPAARPADTVEFLAAQDRAASHSSRSR